MESLQELNEIAQLLKDATVRRNQLILQARLDGWPIPALAEAALLSVGGISLIAKAENGGVNPIPRQKQKSSFK